MNTSSRAFARTLLPLLLPLAATPALAQSSVELYGIVDIGLLTQSHSGTSGRLTQVASSGYRQSEWGLRGKEKLNEDLTAFFNLESHFQMDTGALAGTGDSAGTGTVLFRRQANLGLSGSWGSVTLGRQYGPALLAHLGTEPRIFKEQFSNIYMFAYNQYAATLGPIPAGTNNNNDVGIFMKNAVQYRNTWGPVTLGVAYAPGEVAGSTSRGSNFATGLTYKGPLELSFSSQHMKDAGTGAMRVKHFGYGAALPVGAFTLKANYLTVKNDSPASVAVSDVRGLGLGVDWDWSPVNKLTLAYYHNKDRINTTDATRNVVISNDYSLSKRTILYIQGAYVDAKAGATLKTSIVAAGIPAQNAKTNLLNIGINHTF
jgi:predicted porin